MQMFPAFFNINHDIVNHKIINVSICGNIVKPCVGNALERFFILLQNEVKN